MKVKGIVENKGKVKKL